MSHIDTLVRYISLLIICTILMYFIIRLMPDSTVHSEKVIDNNNYIYYLTGRERTDPSERGDIIGHLVAGCNPEWTGVRSCDSMIKYFIAENYNLGYDRISPTKDYGICQINQFAHRYTEMWNAESMRTGRWKDSGDQITYCIGVRQNLWERKMHPGNRFYAYKG